MTVIELRHILEGVNDRAVVVFPGGKEIQEVHIVSPSGGSEDYTFGKVILR